MANEDINSTVGLVSFDAFQSSHSIADAAGRTDRIRVWNYSSIANGSITNAIFKLWLAVEALQERDYVHVIMTHTAADGTVTKYCIKDFTIAIVPNDTNLTCNDKM